MRARKAPPSIYRIFCCCCFICLLVIIYWFEMTTSVSSRQFATGLRIGHVNVYHLYNKVQDVCMLLTKSPYIHLLAFSETRLNRSVDDESLSIPNYTFHRRDAAHRGQTGMGLHVHHSIVHTIKQPADLESERVECMWVEIKHSPSSATLVGYVYRNHAVTYAWFDDFVKMMDKVNEGNSNIVLL